MGWAKFAIEQLQQGEVTKIRPKGHSMTGRVNHNNLVTLKPCQPDDLKVNDVVLVKVKGRVYLHLVKAVNHGRYLIGNNRGGINGWVGANSIYGIATHVEP